MNLINGTTEVGKRLECGLAKVIISFFFSFFSHLFNLLLCVFVRMCLNFSCFFHIHHLSSSLFIPSIIAFSVISVQW